MEQTLGKRIAENRKRMKLTQDQLAEQLGITAQAVSKWENDQSCPDITMLPRLAKIFGITTDQLLGTDPEQPVFEAEVVGTPDDHNFEFEIGDQGGKGNWSFDWNSGRRGSLAFAIWVLLCGGLLLAANLMQWDVGFWEIFWPSGLLVFGLSGLLRRFRFFSLGCALFGGYFLANNLNLLPFHFGKEILLPVFLVLFGLSLLVDALRKPKKPVFHVTHNGKNAEKFRSNCNTDREKFECDLSFGERNYRVDLPVLTGGRASVSFGELTVDLSGCETVAQDCHVQANCSFGELRILVPRRFRVEPKTGTAFAEIHTTGHPDPEPQGILYMNANASFGEISIQYI